MCRLKKPLLILFITIFIFFIASVASAENLGVYGQVFPITEIDMLDFIHARLAALQASGQLEQMQKTFKERVTAHILRPAPVEGMTKASKSRTFYYDPTFIVQSDIYDENGNVLIPAGTTVNPLSKIILHETLFFINADDSAEINWVKLERQKLPESQQSKVILVNGNIQQASQKLGRIYFDQAGKITEKLGIHHVPSMAYQEGSRLVIREVAL